MLLSWNELWFQALSPPFTPSPLLPSASLPPPPTPCPHPPSQKMQKTAKQQQDHLNQGFPSATPFSSSAACPTSPGPHSAPFPFISFVCLFAHRQACVWTCERVNALVRTRICMFERRMSVTGFEREHVCPRTYQIPTPCPLLFSHSASLAPPPPSPSSIASHCSAYKVPQRSPSVPTCCCPASHISP